MPLFFKHQRNAQPRMPWGVVGAIGGAVVNNVMAPKGGGSSSQQSSSEPWAMAQPWMLSNIMSGMNIQNGLTANPFSPQQQAAYDNSYALNDYMRNLVPGLLGQLGSQQVGFDPKNPSARPQAWNWAGPQSDGSPNLGQRSVLGAKPAAAAPAEAAPKTSGDFVNQNDVLSGLTMRTPDGNTLYGPWGQPMLGNGGYGAFKYGMATPTAGTQAYRDMSEYFNYGGADPNNLYGRGKPLNDPNADWLARGGGA